jgi:hypothetical protein
MGGFISITPIVPLIPRVALIVACQNLAGVVSHRDVQNLTGFHLPGKAIVDGFQLPSPHDSIRIAVLSNVETITALLGGGERYSRRVNLERNTAPTHQGA